jgi:small subunit ribosomal protein S7
MKNGKKSVAMRLVYEALDIVAEKTKRDHLEVFEQVLQILLLQWR